MYNAGVAAVLANDPDSYREGNYGCTIGITNENLSVAFPGSTLGKA